MKAFVINLDSRPDRMKLFKENRFPFEVTRVSGVVASCGEDGCTQSHLQVIASQHEFPFVVFEDDCMMIRPWSIVEKALSQLPNKWDALWLGATIRQPLVKYSTNLYKLRNAWCLHAVIYNSREMIDYILQNHNTPSGRNLDIFYHLQVMNAYRCFVTYPLCATQRNDYSDICKKKIDYNKEIEKAYSRWIR